MNSVLKWAAKTTEFATRAALLACVACSGGADSEEGVLVRLPWLNKAKSNYESQDVRLKTISDIHHIEGSSATVNHRPIRKGKSGEMNLSRQRFRFLEDGDVHVPADKETLQVAAVYAHLEKLREMDKKLGLESALSWPRKVGVNVSVPVKDKEGEFEKNNAFYYWKSDSIIIVPYETDDLPMSVNGGILAHEHFHALFQSLVLEEVAEGKLASGHVVQNWKKAGDRQRRLSAEDYNIWLFRAINEGLADVWAWIYNQDDGMVARSLPRINEARKLNARPTPLPALSSIEQKLEQTKGYKRLGLAYQLGTRYARILRSLVVEGDKKPTEEQRKEFGLAIIKGLKNFADKARSHWVSNKKMSPDIFIQSFKAANPSWAKKHCVELAEYTLISQNNKREACK